jgi:hypothetical protein
MTDALDERLRPAPFGVRVMRIEIPRMLGVDHNISLQIEKL